MRKIYFVIIIIVFILSYNLAQGRYNLKSPEVSDVSSDGHLFTEVKGDLISVDIRDVTLNEVLKQLSAQNGITFLLPPSLGEEKIMVRFSNYKIDKGLNKILSSYDHIFIYTEEESNPHQSPLTRLKEVRIYPRYEDKKKGKLRTTSVRNPKAPRQSRKSEGKAEKRSGKKEFAGKKSAKTISSPSKDKRPVMSVDEVKALAERGDTNAIGSLTSALKDKNPEVKKEAEKALEEIGESLKEEYESQANPDEEELTSPPEEGEKSLTLAAGSANGVNLELNNDVPVRGVQFTLNGAKATEVRTTSRTEGFLARVNEKNGTVVLVSLSGSKIGPGTGPIAEIICDNKGSASLSNVKIE